jgi:DNA-directed RNA polymerase subunit L
MEFPETIFDSDVKNDRVDLRAEPDVNIQKITTKDIRTLKMILEGKSIDNSIVNAIRRSVLMYVPIYGYYRTNIHIEQTKSKHMYNNDMIYNQIETLPIFDIPNFFDLEDPETFLSDDVMKSIFSRYIQDAYEDMEEIERREKEPIRTDPNKKQFKIEFLLNVKNTTDEDLFVSTHHAIFKIDDKTSNNYKNHEPICLFVLRPTEEISLRAVANLGIAKIHAAYEATDNAVHRFINPSKYELEFKTLGQLDKHIIFQKACIILIKKLEMLKSYIHKKYPEEPDKDAFVEIELAGEEHTIGNLLATVLQKCDSVKEAGYVVKHPFTEIVTIRYRLEPKSKAGPITIFKDCIAYLIKVYYSILNEAFKNPK